MRVLRVAVGILSFASPMRAQSVPPIPIDSATRAFAQAHALCSADAGALWGVSLCGPIMFVDAPSRTIVASARDTKGELKPSGGVFVGMLPANQNVANTAFDWSGVRWTQMLWPIPSDERLRATLMVHELFHRIQGQLKLPAMKAGDNAHLDELEGRYYMQLEWRALARALEEHAGVGVATGVRDALLFRAERYRIYPRAAAEERALEMNEGLAEYTGVRVGNPTPALRTKMALHDLLAHVDDQTFVRSFAYATGPAYGLLLDRYAPGWRRELRTGASMDSLLRRALHAGTPGKLEQGAPAVAKSYGGETLRAAEVVRDRKRQETLAQNRRKFIDGAKLTLKFQHMNVQFDPRTLQPLADEGTVYPTIHISDDWGIIDAKNGALMKPDWSALVVVAPSLTEGSHVSGDGWTLELKPGWKIIPGARRGDFTLSPP